MSFSETFNSTTIKGRANSAKATLGAIGGAFLYYKLFGGKKVSVAGNMCEAKKSMCV